MCGIAGLSLAAGKQVAPVALRALSDALAHRGPDGKGVYVSGNVGLVHRRLSIIDVTGGAQPISDRHDKIHIVGNGEIYNFVALQRELEAAGVSLKTRSDTETALHLYARHGAAFVNRLEGMYALAIYDETSRTLVLCRDPFGIKPLYYARTDAGFAFASEPAALTKAGLRPAAVNRAGLGPFLNRQYLAGRDTLFAGIERVLPGEVLVVRDGAIVSRTRHPPPLGGPQRHADAMRMLDGHLAEAVERHLQSEVPYGAFLSGGIDSSAMVIKMAAVAGTIRTFTIGFASATVSDERAVAERLARELGTDHTAVLFDEDDFWSGLPAMCRAMDDLVADYAALPLLKLAEAAAPHVKVILSGEGGDEIFAGYGRYRRGWWDTLRRRPFRGRGDLAGFERLFTADLSANHQPAPPAEASGLTRLQRRQARDIADWLPDDLLTKVDRCLMAHGIEGRVPYLDQRLAAFGFGLPDRLKVRGRIGKHILKAWLKSERDWMDVWARKRGFTVPIQDWLNRRRETLARYLAKNDGVQEVVHPLALETLLGAPLDRKAAKLVFSLLCFGLWHEIHVGGGAPELA